MENIAIKLVETQLIDFSCISESYLYSDMELGPYEKCCTL